MHQAESDIIAEALILHRGLHPAGGVVRAAHAAGNRVARALTLHAITRIIRTPGSRRAERQKEES